MKRSLLILVLTSTLVACGCATVAPPAAPPPVPPVVVPYEQKLAWILRLEDQRVLRDPTPAAMEPALTPQGGPAPVASAPVPRTADLTQLLTDADARIRRRAALAVGHVGSIDGTQPLLGLLGDPDPEVRQMTCFALGLLRDASAVDPLVAALDDADLRVQGLAAEALGSIGESRAAAAVGTMVARHAADPAVTSLAIDDLSYQLPPAADAFRLGLYALVRLKAWEPMASAVLDAGGAPRVRWWPVAYAIQRIEDRRAVPALLAFARGSGVDAVAFGARGLGVLKDPRGVPALIPLLDPAKYDRRVVATAARALGQIGDVAAVQPLLQLVRRPQIETGTRVEAIVALGELKGRAALDDLLDLIGHPDPATRGAALGSVAALDQETFITVLSGLDPDPTWQVRADLARALGLIERERALPRLLDLAHDSDQRVVATALRALGEVKAPTLPDLLREQLKADDFAVRATAAELAGTLRPAGGDEWLKDAWQRGKSDATYVARAAALVALAAYGLDAARSTIEEALGDADWAVRVRASQLLLERDPRADVSRMRPAPVKRSAADYAATTLTGPPYSPQVYLDTKKGTIQIELHVLDAPLTVANFVELARKGFFNGLLLHRVVPNFVVQVGDPRSDGEGGPGYTIRDEVNQRPYLRGTVGMALDWQDTGGSQFFITHGPQPHLDGRYTVFGTVVAGMDVVDRLERWDSIDQVRVWDGVQAPTQ